MKRFGAMLLTLGLAIAGQVLADEPVPKATGGVQVVLAMNLDGWVDVDAAGKVVGYGTDAPVPQELRVNVDRAIRAWLFEPVSMREGQSAARTRMRLTLRAEPQGQGYVARIEDVFFPADPVMEAAAVSSTPAPIVLKSTRKPRMMLGGIATGTLIAIKVPVAMPPNIILGFRVLLRTIGAGVLETAAASITGSAGKKTSSMRAT